MNNRTKLLEVRDLVKHFSRVKGFRKKVLGLVKAVDGVNLNIRQGETLALVGESGSGKTTLGRTVLRAIEPTSGEIYFSIDNDASEPIDMISLKNQELRGIRKNMSMIFQDPFSSLNPRFTVMDIIIEPCRNHGTVRTKKECAEKAADLLKMVGLNPDYMTRYPHAFSGGQRQRIAIARALALSPKFVVADEPVSALDVSVQAQILNLMKELQERLHLTYLFVAHNLAVVEYVSSRVAVMYVGKIVELADTNELFGNPKHPYTEALISAVPIPNPKHRKNRIILSGDIADPANPPSGCYFHPRCRYAKGICTEETPPLVDLNEGERADHLVACHFGRELKLLGVE